MRCYRGVIVVAAFLFGFAGVTGHAEDAPEAPWNLSADTEVDLEGLLSQRFIGSIDGHRVVWWSTGALVLSREEAAPAGMVERQYRFHNPLNEMVHRAGAAAGPLVLGPVDLRGSYRRFLDPSTGGIVPTSAAQSTGARLDASYTPGSWDGMFLNVPGDASRRGHVGPVAPFAVGGGYVHNPDRAHLLLGRVESAPAGGRFGGLILSVGSAEALSRGVPATYQPPDEPWIHPVSPVRTPVYRGVGLAYLLDRGTFRDAVWPWGVRWFFLAEGWRQWYSYRPARHAGSVVMSLGVPELTVSVRSLLVEPGYLDVDMNSPMRNSFSGLRVDGRVNLPERKPRNRPMLEWRGELFGDRRWDNGLPSEEYQIVRSAFLAYRSGGWLRLLKGDLSGEYRAPWTDATVLSPVTATEDDGSATAQIAFSPPLRFHWGVKPVAGGSCRYRWSDDSRRVSVELSAARRDARGSSWNVKWEVNAEENDGDWSRNYAISADAAIGPAVTVAVRCSFDEQGTPGESWNGLVRLSWYRSGILGGDLSRALSQTENDPGGLEVNGQARHVDDGCH